MRTQTKGWRWAGWAVAIVVVAGAGCSSSPAMVRHMEARRIAAELRVHFTKATDAANKAVMADTDEMSAAFAREAELETHAVEADVETLSPLVNGLRYEEEGQLLQAFATSFAEYRELDRRILQLAVENTNLKAQRIAFGPGQEAVDTFSDALASLAPGDASNRWRVQAAAATAVARVREIQVMQAPHIASSSDAAMTSLEQRMAASEAATRAALETLAPLVRVTDRARLAAAGTALDRFMALNGEIAALSRRNTNVRSLALTLNDKGKLTAACDERLQALQETLGRRQIGGTR